MRVESETDTTRLRYSPNAIEFLVSLLQSGPCISGTSSDKLAELLEETSSTACIIFIPSGIILTRILLLLTSKDFWNLCWTGSVWSVCRMSFRIRMQEFLIQLQRDVSPENGYVQVTYGFVMLKSHDRTEILWVSNKHNQILFQCVLCVFLF